jgi:7-cyano-7-deazaguanine synthase
MASRILVLLSGGVDSSALLCLGAEVVGALHVSYNPATSPYETRAASTVARKTGVSLHTMSVVGPPLGRMGDAPGTPGPRVMAGRNLWLAAFAVGEAARVGADVVWCGAIAEDRAAYPDCRAEFWAAADRLCRDTYGIGVEAPLVGHPKTRAVELCLRAGLLDLTWSCYAPLKSKPCGGCDSCRSRAAAVAGAHAIGQRA